MYRDDYKWLASHTTELLLNEERREACIAGLKEVNICNRISRCIC